MFLALELCLTAIAVAIAYTYPQLGERWFDGIERSLAGLANRQLLAAVTIGLLAIGLRLALLPILPIPVPEVHDEYSHLLLADTLAHGRLANPTHPMWIHFETFHVNWHPTYASMYYPGHALFLAFGQVVLGNPFWGVLLSSGLMCAAICWALQGWMPPGWALLGAFLAVINLGTFGYWVNSYWGGTVPAFGGALMIGAFPRLKKGTKIRDSILLGMGAGVIALTRPYEGIFFSVPIVVALTIWTVQHSRPKLSLVRIGLPAILTLSVGLAWLGYYFWRVTGSPFVTGYEVNMRTYGLVYFPWDRIKPIPEFHHLAMQRFYRGGPVLGAYDLARHNNLKLQIFKAVVLWLFYCCPLLTMPWLFWIFTRPYRKFWRSFSSDLRFMILLCACVYASLMLTIYIGQPHYAAPAVAAFYAATVLVLLDLSLTSSGRFIARSVPLIALTLFSARTAAPLLHLTPKPSSIRTWSSQYRQNFERARVLNQLEHTPGQHLVIVRYRPNHDYIIDEWVFNDADIDGSKVIWARDMGPKNGELLQYFSKRKAWLVEPDDLPVKLAPYGK